MVWRYPEMLSINNTISETTYIPKGVGIGNLGNLWNRNLTDYCNAIKLISMT